ncbi:Protein kinase superfamily protein [Rhynchospora pubera]|uniref:Protein kinase superfamily protein n=1 Tax=Rhynchospora pubera TaxID=906938 RepID=A0AAV8HUX7_9POAL|nr:Protein kinase superfamily protein [Rhynchospora pubera]KAJ4820299.1 Protein kinase superfamily protein [Rhynchospora pubera]
MMRRGGAAGSVQQYPNSYRLRDLKKATNNFSNKKKLGSGGSADVYKGQINGKMVAIKKLHGSSVQQLVDIGKEVQMLHSLEHENIVKLLGFCSEDGQYLLVYEYVQNGNLATYLNDESKREELNWGMRFNIINGIARGLSYLHHDSKDSVIHRDLKPENVLLDKNYNAKIADFGISKILDKSKTHSTTRNGSGTPGYLAPEIWYLQHYSPKSDVYNFGLLILEIIVGCTSAQYSKRNGQILSHVVWHQWKNNTPLIHITDMYVQEELSQDQIKNCILTGLLCIQNYHSKRPSMMDVLQMLNTNISLPVPDVPGFLHEGQPETSKTSLSSISSSSLESALVLTSPSYNDEIDTLPTPGTEGMILSSPNLKAFSFNDLKTAIISFIGEGSPGFMFKGWLWLDKQTLEPTAPIRGIKVVVQEHKPDWFWDQEEWQTLVDYLGRLNHPNLIKLIGYCSEGGNRLLVHEFMPKGSLGNHLFKKGENHLLLQPLSWEIRLNIAIGAAKALSFLHDAESQVIYPDFEASNILLDSDYNAKLAGFGLANAKPTRDTTSPLSPFGYAAPEYMATGYPSAEANVYNFGVVLLELLSGQRVKDYKINIALTLDEWAKFILGDEHKLHKFIDSRLEGQYPEKGAQALSNLALRCISYKAKLRPNMSKVLKELEKLQDPKYNALNNEV